MTYPTLTLPLPQKGQDTKNATPAGAGGPAPTGSGSPTPGGQVPGSPNDPANQQTPAGDQCMSSLPLLLGMFAIMYFLLIRPQQKQEKRRREMVSSLKKGDHVVMNSGLHGVVDSLAESTVDVRVDREVVLTFDRTAIQRSGAASDAEGAKKQKSEGAA